MKRHNDERLLLDICYLRSYYAGRCFDRTKQTDRFRLRLKKHHFHKRLSCGSVGSEDNGDE